MLFILGAPPSGTTLLAQCLNAHDDILITHETDYVILIASIVSHVADPTLGLAMIREVIPNTSLFRGGQSLAEYLTVSEIADAVARSEYRLPSILGNLFGAIAEKHGVRWVGDKTPNYLQHVRTFDVHLASSGDFHVLHIVRDIRDVMLSLNQQGWAAGLDRFYPRMWNSDNLYLRAVGESLGSRYHRLRYEDLVRDPESRFRDICRFLQVPYDPRMLLPERRHPLYRSMPHHAQLYGPIRPERIGRYRTSLDRSLVRSYETQAQEAMMAFGYEFDALKLPQPLP